MIVSKPKYMGNTCSEIQVNCWWVKSWWEHVYPEMHQCTLILSSMWATSLFRGVICQWMVNKLQTGKSKKIYLQNAKCNFHLLLKLKFLNTRCTSISIMNWANSHIIFTTWQWTSKVEPHMTALAFINETFLWWPNLHQWHFVIGTLM